MKLGAELAALPDSSSQDDTQVALYLSPRRRSAATIRAYAPIVEEFRQFCGVPLSRIGVGELNRWLQLLNERGIGPAGQAQRISVVRGLLKQCHDSFPALYPVNVGALDAFLPPRRAKGETLRVLTREQVVSLILGQQDKRTGLMLACLYGLGLRVSELCALDWKDFEWLGGRKCWAVRVLGKGQKWRTVPVPGWLYDMLEPGEGRLFNISRQRAWELVKRAAKRAGISDVSPHWFRHACASHLLESGATEVEVRDLLGHASISTLNIYLHNTRGRVVAEGLNPGGKETDVKVT